MKYWIMKSEPDVFSINHLEKVKIATWDGVRNYQVRNMMRDLMKVGDLAYFYHSSCEHVGIAGLMKIISSAKEDNTFKLKKEKNNPWLAVEVEFISKMPNIISLKDLKATYSLQNLKILRKGNRLSITEITENEFNEIERLVMPL